MKKLLLVPVLVAALLGLLAAPALASPKTFYVHPSGGSRVGSPLPLASQPW